MLRVLAAAAALLVILIMATVATAGLAFAQESAPAAPPVGTEAIIVMIRDSAVAVVLALFSAVMIWARSYLPQWLTSMIDANESRDSDAWEAYKRKVAEDAITFAIAKTGLTPENIKNLEQKQGFIGWATHWFAMNARDILKYYDKDENGVPDFIEVQLRKIAPSLPVTPMPPEAPTIRAAVEAAGFMSPQQRRAARPKPAPSSHGVSTPEEIARRLSKKPGTIQ